jgi:hypothetical protein
MLTKIDNSKKTGNGHISILYPGKALGTHDTGFASIGRIDQAKLPPGSFIAMHPHVNDEILSYFRTGKVKHTDSEGFSEFIEPSRLMLMKAGKSFFHEEKILDNSDVLEGLQIFIRPKEKDLRPEIIFHELDPINSINQWRLLASPTKTTPLQFSSDTWIYDMRVTNENDFTLPVLPTDGATCLLYVFQGKLKVNAQIKLSKGDSLLIQRESVTFNTMETTDVVVFMTDENSSFYDGGMYSGNQLKK